MLRDSAALIPVILLLTGMDRWASSSLRSIPAEASASANSLVSVAFGGCPPPGCCEGGGGGSMEVGADIGVYETGVDGG